MNVYEISLGNHYPSIHPNYLENLQSYPWQFVRIFNTFHNIYRSVREYCRWMIEHPEHRRAPYLNSLGMFDLAVLEARHTMELNLLDLSAPLASPTDTPAPIDQIRRKLSELAEPTT